MANPLRGEVEMQVGGKTYLLRLSVNQLIAVQKLTGLGLVQLEAALADTANFMIEPWRAVLWAGLQERHPEIDLEAAGDLIGEAGVALVTVKVGEALQAAFPQPTRGAPSANPRKSRRGTGKRSS